MTREASTVGRRTVLRTISGTALAGIAGCLDNGDSGGTPGGGNGVPDNQNALKRVAVDGTAVVVEMTEAATVDQVNLIQPNRELFGKRSVAAGSRQVSFEIGTSYTPGEYRVLALKGEERVVETSLSIRPELKIQDIGLYRNNPDKPWDEVYGESKTDAKKNGEVFITVENTGNGPSEVSELRFTGDVPNPIENPRGDGVYGTDRALIVSQGTTDLYSDSFPFGTETEDGMGCSTERNSGQFTVVIETQVTNQQVTKKYNVQYSGAEEMQNCEITIGEV